MARPKKQDSTLSRERILVAALALLEENGAEALTFRGIAKQMGVTAMAITHHVGTREELVASLARKAFEELQLEFNAPTPQQRIRDMLGAYCEWTLRYPQLMRCVILNPASLEGVAGEFDALLRRELEQSGVAASDIQTVVSVLIDYTHGFAIAATGSRTIVSTATERLGIEEFFAGINWVLGRLDA
ncbi:TetR/AcrR family transcriptional regulator [Rhodobacteraceae bacterium RKSG542]|uniref:TetR/AcrR family transcriptional regulator n=1 Tax=Pseudovibrio flavus TaxID=2529854 RepID=UPI0012BCC0A5|nr:TetR/AcrR family transcriptional regulator [Pseudovibrio flavus]MTI16548.1 TetR/AcrR family transcriptional regulator [Pseudovibrio flavus]